MNSIDPPLTTVRQPIEPMGRMVIELLVAQLSRLPGRPRRSTSSSPSSWSAASTGPVAAVASFARYSADVNQRNSRKFLAICLVLASILSRKLHFRQAGVDLPVRRITARTTRVDADVLAPQQHPPAPARRRATAPLSPAATTRSGGARAVIYQIYVRSFADGNGDGTGDLAGVRSRLGYLRDLGVDAIWFTPWYPQPARRRRLRRQRLPRHPPRLRNPARGRAARAGGAGPRHPHHHRRRPEPRQRPARLVPGGARRRPRQPRARALLVPRRRRAETATRCPTTGSRPFAGETWTRTTNPDGTPGQWYLHLFTPEQPDLNWNHPDVRREHEDILRFWFDRGVAGVRIDSAALLIKDPDARRGAREPGPGRAPDPGPRRAARRLPRAGARSPTPTRARACWSARSGFRRSTASSPTCAPTRCTPRSTSTSWRGRGAPPSFARVIDQTLAAHAPVRRAEHLGAVSNHDVTRPVTRYGREDSSFAFLKQALRHPDRPRARHPPRPRRRPADRRPARLALHLPGRRARPARGRGHPARAAAGPDALPLAGRRPGPGRMPRAASLERHRSAVRVQLRRTRRASRGCRSPRSGRATRSRRGADPHSMLSLYRAGARASARTSAELGDGPLDVARPRARRPRVPRAATTSSASRTSPTRPLDAPRRTTLVLASDGARRRTAWRASPRLHGVAAHHST